MEDDKTERQRRLQRQMSERFEKSHALRNEQDKIEKRMAELEEEFQDCQNGLRVVKAKIVDNETVSVSTPDIGVSGAHIQQFVIDDDDDSKPILDTHMPASKMAEVSRTTTTKSKPRSHRRSDNQYVVGTTRPGLSAYTGRVKSTIMRKDHVHPTKGKPYLCEDYPTIVKLEQGWAETWCHVCSANSTKRGFLSGLLGLLNHVQVRHRKEHPRISFKELLDVCGIHYLEEHEVVSLCLWEKKVNPRFETDGAKSNELSDEVLLQKANERLGGQYQMPQNDAHANAASAGVNEDEEDIVVRSRKSHSESMTLPSEDQVEQSFDNDEAERALGVKIKEEFETDSEYEDGHACRVGANVKDAAESLKSDSSRVRKRRRLHVLPGSDDEDENEQ